MIRGILGVDRKGLAISINELKELPQVTERYFEAELVVSAPLFCRTVFRFCGNRQNQIPCDPLCLGGLLGSLRIQAY
jgi:hypothetical protein